MIEYLYKERHLQNRSIFKNFITVKIMKMHHLEEDEVKAIMEKVKTAVGEKELNTDKVEEIFELSKVKPKGFLDCKSNEMQAKQVNFEIDESKGIRFFDPFNFYTQGIYKDMDGWSVWTIDNLKEPWAE